MLSPPRPAVWGRAWLQMVLQRKGVTGKIEEKASRDSKCNVLPGNNKALSLRSDPWEGHQRTALTEKNTLLVSVAL